jgi:hypothetical protein
MVKAKKNNYADFEFEVEEYVDVETKIVNIILDDGTTYDFQGEDILNNSTVQTILNQQLNQTYYSIFDYGKKYKGGEKK